MDERKRDKLLFIWVSKSVQLNYIQLLFFCAFGLTLNLNQLISRIVGVLVWCRNWYNISGNLDAYIMVILQGRSMCTITKFKTLENLDEASVLKDQRKCWDDAVVKGQYNKSNILLLDDSPYKALINSVSFHFSLFLDFFSLLQIK